MNMNKPASNQAVSINTQTMNDELVGAIYMVVGQGTEGGSASYHLSIAGLTVMPKGREPYEPQWGEQSKVAGKSGYSIGAIQVDLGQRGEWPVGAVTDSKPQAGDLSYVDAIIQAAAAYAQARQLPFTNDHAKLRADLLSKGHDHVDKGGKPVAGLQFIDTDTRDSINAWAGSAEGKQWIHQNIDLPQARNITQIALDTLNKHGKKDFKAEERFESLCLIAKAANQLPFKVIDLQKELKKEGGYDGLLEKSRAIKATKPFGYFAADKAGEIGRKYEEHFLDTAAAAKLRNAHQKVSSAAYSPTSQNTDEDVRFAVNLAKAGGERRLTKDEISQVQQNLNQLGYKGADGKPLVTDGGWNANTRHALKAFQQATKGLTADGKWGPATQQALREAIDKQQAQLPDTPYHQPLQQHSQSSLLEPLANSSFQGQPGLLALSHKIGGTLPDLTEQQNAQLTVYLANRSMRERMPIEDIGRLVFAQQNGRDLLHAVNQSENQVVTANVNKALNTPIEQSLAALQETQQPQQLAPSQQLEQTHSMRM